MRPLPRFLAAALLVTLPAASASASASVPEVLLTPTSVDRGPDTTLARVDTDGRTVVDGAVRFTVAAPRVVLLGTSGAASYVVATSSPSGGHGRVWRYATDGSRALLATSSPARAVLSGDGATLVVSRAGRGARATITAYDVASGTLKARRGFGDHAVALDAQSDQVVLGGARRTRLWTTSTGSVTTVSRDAGYVADLSADVVATFDKDPYDGGCSRLRRISSGQLLWRSCRERVLSVSPDGARVATKGILLDFDFPGPPVVDVRTLTGRHLGRYSTATYFFGTLTWESPTSLLLEVVRPHKAYVARCTGPSCERASDYYDTDPLAAYG